MLVGKTWRLQTRRRRGARARGRRSRRGSRQRRARISPRHPRRTRVARRSNPRHGRPSDPPPATSACAGAAPPRGATTTKGLKKLGGRAANAPFFAARTTWTRRTGATRAGAAARTAEPATRARAESTTGVEVIADIVVPNGGLVVSACSLQESARSYCGVIPRWRPPFRMSISVRTGLNRPAQGSIDRGSGCRPGELDSRARSTFSSRAFRKLASSRGSRGFDALSKLASVPGGQVVGTVTKRSTFLVFLNRRCHNPSTQARSL